MHRLEGHNPKKEPHMPHTDRLRRFIADFTSLVGGAVQDRDEVAITEVGRGLLTDLVSHDDWLPESMAKCPPHGYAQNLLWCDPFERFSVVSFVWAPSARTPIHDHQVWGMVGILRGSESSQRFAHDPSTGQPNRFVSGYSNLELPNLWDRRPPR
jgi:predicted metal-dependent enzyme (double-stranded beta helix superfamily)